MENLFNVVSIKTYTVATYMVGMKGWMEVLMSHKLLHPRASRKGKNRICIMVKLMAYMISRFKQDKFIKM